MFRPETASDQRASSHRERPTACRSASKLALAAFAFTMLLLGCAKEKKEEEPERTVSVEVAPVVTGTIQQTISADAVLYPLQQAAIVPKITAPVKKFYVDRGSRVHANQLLAELEDQDLVGAADESRGGYEQAQAQYEVAVKSTVPEELQKAELDAKANKEAFEAQQKIYENRQALYKEGAVSAKDVNDALVALAQARSQYEIAQKHLEALQGFGKDQEIKAAAAQLAAAKGKVIGAEAQVGYAKIYSPIDGVVTDRPVYKGEMPPSGAPIITVMDLSEVIARCHISQQQAAQLKVGDAASLTVPGEDHEFPGKVTVVSPALDPNSTTVEVWVKIPNADGRLKPGSSARLQITTATVANALVIPASSVLTSSSGAASVMTVDSENKPHKKRVTTGIRDSGQIQITEGLQSGDRVVTVGAFELAKEDEDVLAKTKVQIQSSKAPEDEDEDEDQ